MKIAVVGIDLGKNVCSVVGLDASDAVVPAAAGSAGHANRLGLVPRQATTGGKPRLMGISKRGNKYLRTLLIHGARAALPHLAEKGTTLGRWVKNLLSRVHQNVAVVTGGLAIGRSAHLTC
jgi:transposase